MKEKEKSEPVKKEENISKKDKQVHRIIFTMVAVIGVFIVFYFIFNSLQAFKYNGLSFTKEKFGEIPVFHHYYNFDIEGKLIKYNLYLRNDPRTNNVPITGEAIDEGIEFRRDNTVYVSVSPKGLDECEYSRVGISNLALFLADNQLNVKGASPNEDLAKESNIVYATCDTHSNDVVILIRSGEETEIIHEKNNCYIIQIANCQVLEAIEKFQVQSILDARERRQSQ